MVESWGEQLKQKQQVCWGCLKHGLQEAGLPVLPGLGCERNESWLFVILLYQIMTEFALLVLTVVGGSGVCRIAGVVDGKDVFS